jgi:asparagine synthase (glutamine-hydrolysing)
MGFTAPIPGWLRGELSGLTTDTLLGPASRERGIVDPQSVELLIRRHNAGEDHTRGLWTLLMLELWFQEFIDRRPADRSQACGLPIGADGSGT